VKCGFCCDGTLFPLAALLPGEKGSLPEKIEQNYYKLKDKEYFKLPCQYFWEKCTIYDRKRADVCGSFRCQLLIDFADQKISDSEALEIIVKAKATRSELLDLFRKITGNNTPTPFYPTLVELGKVLKNKEIEGKDSPELEIILARFNIFESLLIKHFKSSLRFESLILPEVKDE